MFIRRLYTCRKTGLIIILFLPFILTVTPVSANLFRVTYEVTFTNIDFQASGIIPPTVFFGIAAGPYHFTASFLIETGFAPDIFYQEGIPYPMMVTPLKPKHDIYAYYASRISDLSCTVGTKTWDNNDILVKLDGSGVWFDRPLVDGATPLIRIDVDDSDGSVYMGTAGSAFGEFWMYNMTSVKYKSQNLSLDTWSYPTDTFVTVHDITNVPEPTTMLLLGLGLVGIAGMRRRMQR